MYVLCSELHYNEVSKAYPCLFVSAQPKVNKIILCIETREICSMEIVMVTVKPCSGGFYLSISKTRNSNADSQGLCRRVQQTHQRCRAINRMATNITMVTVKPEIVFLQFSILSHECPMHSAIPKLCESLLKSLVYFI
jgi:hypothetical protein